MLVVGFFGNDQSLGRTFLCSGDDDANKAILELATENGELESLDLISGLVDQCCIQTEMGTYFCGELESI